MSRYKGFTIDGTNFVVEREGAYGAVFVDRVRGRVRKVMTRGHPRDHCAETFASETTAYEVATRNTVLSTMVPEYFGIVASQRISDRNGGDVTPLFYADLTFEMAFVDCGFIKIAHVDPAERAKTTALFAAQGILYMTDASACVREGKIVKVIDFGMKEVEAYW